MRLLPQNRAFFVLLSQASANALEISRTLERLLEDFPERLEEHAARVQDLEHEGDRLTHDAVDLLNRTFVTPFDRDDIHRLAGALDDVCDHVDEAAGDVVSYGVGRVRPPALEQANIILRAAEKLNDAVGKLNGF